MQTYHEYQIDSFVLIRRIGIYHSRVQILNPFHVMIREARSIFVVCRDIMINNGLQWQAISLNK